MINRLTAAIKRTGAPIVVGLDPMLDYIPPQILSASFSQCGETLEGAALAVKEFTDFEAKNGNLVIRMPACAVAEIRL